MTTESEAAIELWRKHLTLWRQDVEAVQRKYESMCDVQWDRDVSLTPPDQFAMYRSWCATMTAWWEMVDVIKSLRAAESRIPRREDVTATDVETER